jgi:peptidoglycan/LPS O-acetylase OafA/YrhL
MFISDHSKSSQASNLPVIFTEGSQPKKLDFIDALRGIAALMVVVYHTALMPRPNLEIPIGLDKFVRLGGLGVVLFFVISAFTLYLSGNNRKQETNQLRKFYLRRLFRIVPLFYFMLPIQGKRISDCSC